MPRTFPLFAVFILLVSCANIPKHAPRTELVFDRIEAPAPGLPSVHFILHVSNPRKEAAVAGLSKSRIFVNGRELSDGYIIEAGDGRIEAASDREIALVCRLDMARLTPPVEPGTETIDLKVVLDTNFTFEKGGRASSGAEGTVSFPWIREPAFSIVSIVIMQAELINTRFKVKIKIHNPNPFPVTLSSFNYRLYGAGRYWTGGREKNVYTVRQNDEIEKDLFLVMNFIEMGRDLLNQVIDMRSVPYRFTGEAETGTGVDYLPVFTAAFDLTGLSEVIQ